MAKRLTVTQYANYRKAAGLSGGTRAAVYKASDSGRISWKRGELVDVEATDREWSGDTEQKVEVTGDTRTTSEYQNARAEKTRLQAETSKIKLAQLRGELVAVDQVGRLWSEVLGTLRRLLEVLADRLGPELAAMDSPDDVRLRLRSEHRAALEDAANEIANGG